MLSILVRTSLPFGRRRAAHLRLGQRGERLARTLLGRLGLDVLTTNYRTAQGEVDIVAREGTTLCFVEVKTRHRQAHARPADAVGHEKRRRIMRAARRYRRDLGWPAIPHRYDIVEIVLSGRRVRDVRYWPGAFSEEERPWADTMTRFDDELDD
jgi:putative endonuclease